MEQNHLEDSLALFLRNRNISNKEKIRELEDLIVLAKSAITILQGKGVTSANHLMAVLDEKKLK